TISCVSSGDGCAFPPRRPSGCRIGPPRPCSFLGTWSVFWAGGHPCALRRALIIGDPSQWVQLTGIQPRDLQTALLAEPASVQERWFARLYLLKPLVFALFSVFWIASGAVSLGPGFETGVQLMQTAGSAQLAG